MPKRVDAAEQRRQIRRAGRRVFRRRGVTGTGLAHVAEAARMGRSSLYHYYPDKASLLRDLVRELLDEEQALFSQAARGGAGSPLERVEGLVTRATELFDTWSALGRMVFDLRSLEPGRFRAFFRRIRSDLARLIAEGQRCAEIDPALDPRLAAATVIGAIDGLLLQHLVEPRSFEGAALRDSLVYAVRKVLRP